MDKNESILNADVNPLVAVSLIAWLLIFIVFKFYISGEIAQLQGVTHIQSDEQQHLHLVIDDTWFVYSKEQQLLQKHFLPEKGIKTLAGGFDFFSNGDVLLRVGDFATSASGNLKRFLRIGKDKQEEINSSSPGLMRCSFPDWQCDLFAGGIMRAERPFHVVIDRQHQNQVYLSDTSDHSLSLYSSEGQLLDEKNSGFKFPNGLLLQDGNLYVADTNHKEIDIIETNGLSLGPTTANISSKFSASKTDGLTWPVQVIRSDQDWWLLLKDSQLDDSGVYIFDKQWQFKKRLPLPETSKPSRLLSWNDKVLITDKANQRVLQFSAQGAPQHDYMPTELDRLLIQKREQKQSLQLWDNISMFVFMAGLLLAFWLAVSKIKNSADPQQLQPDHDELALTPKHPELQWMTPDPKKCNTQKFVVPILAICMFLLFFISLYWEVDLEINLVFGISLMLLVSLALYWRGRQLSRQKIGLLDDKVLLYQSPQKYVVGKHQRIYYSDHYILIDNIAINIAVGTQDIFSKPELVEYLYPRLKSARYLKHGAMLNHLIKIGHPDAKVLLLIPLLVASVFWLF